MLIDLAQGQVVLAVAPSRSDGTGGWETALRNAGIPAPDATPVSFADQEMPFVWRSHFVAAATSRLSDTAREIAEIKGWTLFELLETSAAAVPDAMVSMFKD